jgi:bifunctional UDP-N-acetylglucosamine pyrophosphorylase/glucosamine-1-phosphate N-acetyltransferase
MNENKSKIENLIKVAQEKEKARLITNTKHMENGVTFIDWKAAYIDETVVIGSGTVIEPGVILQGKTIIGQDCIIGHNTRIVDSTIGNQVDIQSSVILESQVGNRSKVGPFAYLRPDSLIGEDAKVGDFVEVKNSIIGNGSKASHLTYIGDSQVGDGVNLGCGVIFVNYDGTKKSRSIVKDGAFIGCNTNLISPVTVGEGAYVAAGTTVTDDVPPKALCIGRVKNRNIEGWVKKRGLLKHK